MVMHVKEQPMSALLPGCVMTLNGVFLCAIKKKEDISIPVRHMVGMQQAYIPSGTSKPLSICKACAGKNRNRADASSAPKSLNSDINVKNYTAIPTYECSEIEFSREISAKSGQLCQAVSAIDTHNHFEISRNQPQH